MRYLEGGGFMAGNWARLRDSNSESSRDVLAHSIAYVTERYDSPLARSFLRWGSLCGLLKEIPLRESYMALSSDLRCPLCEEALALRTPAIGPPGSIVLAQPNDLYL